MQIDLSLSQPPLSLDFLSLALSLSCCRSTTQYSLTLSLSLCNTMLSHTPVYSPKLVEEEEGSLALCHSPELVGEGEEKKKKKT